MWRRYRPEEIQFVKKNIRGRSYAEMTRLFNERFGLGITLKQMETLMYKHKLHNGMGTMNGYPPVNKGKTHPSWRGNYRPVGSEREEMGYIVVKISSRKNAGNRNWQRKQVAIWEEAYGKVPKGHAVIFADGNKRNFDLDNLMLVSQKELGVMNRCGLIFNHKDLTAVGKTIADVKLAIGRRKRKLKRSFK